MSTFYLNNVCADCHKQSNTLREARRFAGFETSSIESKDSNGNLYSRPCLAPRFVDVRDVCYPCYVADAKKQIAALKEDNKTKKETVEAQA
jgi:hypothetical protein